MAKEMLEVKFELSSEQRTLQERAAKVGASLREDARDWDESDNAPYREIFDRIAAADLLGIAMPRDYGGRGGTAVDYLIVVEALFRNAQSWLPPEPMFCTSGPGPSILLLGDDAVKEKYLRDGDELILDGTKNFLTGPSESAASTWAPMLCGAMAAAQLATTTLLAPSRIAFSHLWTAACWSLVGMWVKDGATGVRSMQCSPTSSPSRTDASPAWSSPPTPGDGVTQLL